MGKKIILLAMAVTCIALITQLMITLATHIEKDIQSTITCKGKLQLTCGERGCNELCYPLPSNKTTFIK